MATRPPSARGRSRRPLIALVAAHGVSLTGNVLTLIALPLYVLTETGSAAATGLTGAAATVPVVLGGAFGGVLVDRLGYRRASVLADLASGVSIGLVPLLDATVGLSFPALLALVVLTGLLDTPGEMARSALLPAAAEVAGTPLERAVGLFEAVERGARLLGAPLAGVGVALLGPLTVLALDAGTFVLSAGLVARWVPAALGAVAVDESAGGYWRQLRQGLTFTLREPLLRALVLLVLLTNMFDAAKGTVLLPVYADRELGGAVAFGLIVGAMAGGAVVGSLTFSAVGHRLPRRATFVLAFALAGGPPYFALAAGLPLPGILAVTLLSGLGAGAINPIIGAVKLERVPAGMRARVYGLIGAGAWAAMPVGSLLGGVAVEQVGLRTTLVAVGLAYVLLVLTPLLGGPWRELRRPESEPAGRAERLGA
ncbi:MFS transporter [Blastococcus sp. CT_GayMR16]|uniref:MFS transporter n=1 Tax=Blastococcus sp. CT_GayMR16 TaxID=2559607 RepID=UPI0010746A38|nr:MFS transporter [Blastococcus sp. CT_GayMR16]TFV87925.1 MFS transporter [Blastococcus sp. CT_GayMR16]